MPPRFRHLGTWLKKLSPRLTETDLVAIAERLPSHDSELLLKVWQDLESSGEMKEINTWLNEVDWNECFEASRMMRSRPLMLRSST